MKEENMKEEKRLFSKITEGMQKAFSLAVKEAKAKGTKLVFWQDGKIKEFSPREAENAIHKQTAHEKNEL